MRAALPVADARASLYSMLVKLIVAPLIEAHLSPVKNFTSEVTIRDSGRTLNCHISSSRSDGERVYSLKGRGRGIPAIILAIEN